MTVLALLPVITGIWWLADPAFLRQMIDTIGFAVSGISVVLLERGTVTTYVVIALAGVLAAVGLGLVDEP